MRELTGVPARSAGVPSAPEAPPASPRRKVLLFGGGGEWFALPLERVREVCPRAAVTRVPRTPVQVLGVMNLRGRPVILVDLPRCLGLPAGGADLPHVVLLDLGDADLAVGVLADRIDQVVEVEARAGGGPPGAGGGGGAEGPELVEVEGRVATVLDVARVLAGALPGVAGVAAGDAA